jgi:23S rRNA (cytidine1920-2'-O)/16S rRNA (cytidine1409-2'-O)-methyltransferase
VRADQFLVERGLAASRSQAQRLIAAGARWLSPSGWRELSKSDDLPPGAKSNCSMRPKRATSRAAA